MTALTESPGYQPLYTVRQIATSLGVHQTTVRKWIACGEAKVVRVGPYRRIRITAAELDRLSSQGTAPPRGR